MRILFVAACAAIAVGCGSQLSSSPGGNAGAAAGGAQDIGLMRETIRQGQVPRPEAVTPEGLFAEHDLPLDGAGCHDPLCLRLGAAYAPSSLAGDRQVYLQLGMASNVVLEELKRPDLELAVVIDHSCSMGTTRMEAVKEATLKLVDQLDGDDVLSIVKFDDDAQRIFGPAAVTEANRAAIRKAVESIRSEGGTCIECGMRTGYAQLNGEGGQRKWLMLLTDARPNVGATGEGEFTTLIETNAARGVGFTAFGVGLDFGQQLVTRISSVRMANYYFLDSDDRTRAVFDGELPFMVTPIAFDLKLSVEPGAGLTFAGLHGIPGEPGASAASSEVKTVFLSRRKGAIVARLSGGAPTADALLARAKLSYMLADRTPKAAELTASYAGPEPSSMEKTAGWFGSPGIRKTVALTDFIVGAREVCVRHHAGDRAGATSLSEAIAARLEAEATAIGDPALEPEVKLAKDLAALVRR